MALYLVEEDGRGRRLGKQDSCRPYRERKEQARPGGVSEEEPRDRDRHVIWPNPERVLCVTPGGVHKGTVGLNDDLRNSGGSPREQPYRRVEELGGPGSEHFLTRLESPGIEYQVARRVGTDGSGGGQRLGMV